MKSRNKTTTSQKHDPCSDHELLTPPSLSRKARLAPIQHDLYLYNLIHPGSSTYNIGLSIELGSDIDKVQWEAALRRVVMHDDITRSHILSDNDEPCLVVDQNSPVSFRYVDLAGSDSAIETAGEYLWQENERSIDFNILPLVRNYLVKDSDDQYTAALLTPHILLDGVSIQVVFNRIIEAYSALILEKKVTDHRFSSFYDYLENNYPEFDGPERESYWSERFKNIVAFEFLPVSGKGKRNVIKSLRLHRDETSEIREFCQTRLQHVLGFFRLQAFFKMAYAILLKQYANIEEDLVFFEVLAGRPRNHLDTLGCFYTVLPCVYHKHLLTNTGSVSDLLDYTVEYTRNLGTMQNISLPVANKLLANPQIKCFFNYRGDATVNFLAEKKPFEVYMYHPDDEIHLDVKNLEDEIELTLYYNEASFPDCRFLERFRALALQICRSTVPSLTDLHILLNGELESLTKQETPAPTKQALVPETIQHWFEEQAARTPSHVALSLPDSGCGVSLESCQVTGQPFITYSELNEQANQLAHYLREFDIGAGDFVTICLPPTLELVIAIVAIVKTGAAYVPMDPDYPQERLDFILQDTASSLLITRQEFADRFSKSTCRVIALDKDSDFISLKSRNNSSPVVNSNSLAYVIYTSGSTGTPKGVPVTHGNVVRLFHQTEKWFEFDGQDVWTLFHSCTFDFSVWELWGALFYGGRLVIIPKSVRLSTEAFRSVLHQEMVTVLNQTPTAFYNLVSLDSSASSLQPLVLRYVIFGGEALDLAALKPWVDRYGDHSPQLINMYGITETTVHVTYRPITIEDINLGLGSVIGRPIPDLKIYLLDKNKRPVPMGLPGEIHVAGPGVAPGYLNRPELTAKKFIADPFSQDLEFFMYCSGDLGRMLPNGDMEYLGRMDDQVKIRGFRIELGEISGTLLRHDNVSQAAVIAVTTPGRTAEGRSVTESRLVAYLVPAGEKQPTVTELRSYLESHLPDYMMPSAFVFLDSLPLTANNKLDRKSLPQPDAARPDLEESYVPPRTETEEGLAGIFEDILGIEQVGIHDNFFYLGGHSLAATQLASHARQVFGYELPLCKIFETPTVAKLAEYLHTNGVESSASLQLPELKPFIRVGTVPISYSQERVWFLQQLDPSNRAYDFQATLRFSGELDIEALSSTLTEIVRRHEVYRTTFKEINDQVSQIIHPPAQISLPLTDISSLDNSARAAEAERLIRSAAQPSFKLDKLPLVRWAVLKLSATEHILIHCEHHIIHDGWSFVLFLQELLDIYRAHSVGRPSPLPEPSIQFADFAYWQRQWMKGEAAQRQLAFWQDKLQGCPVQLELPFDRPRPAIQSFRGDAIHLDFPADLADAIDSFSRLHGVTPYMTMLAGYLTLLLRYTGQDDIVVGTGIANRRLALSEGLFGMIINNISLRTDLSGNPSFLELAQRVRKTALEAYDNQDVPFDHVVEAVNPVRSASHSPLFQTLFTSYDGTVPSLELPGLSIKLDEGLNNGSAKFDLNVIVISRFKGHFSESTGEPLDTISLIWEYNTDLFNESTMRKMLQSYLRILRSVTANSTQALSDVALLSEQQKTMQLMEFNRTETDYPREATVPELFEQQAAAAPDTVALVFEGQAVSYQELNSRANRLAHYLTKLGVGPEVMVGICAERSIEMIVGILAVLKAGGAFVPLDPDYPKHRLAFMLQDTAAPVLLSQSWLSDLPGFSGQVLYLDSESAAISAQPATNPSRSLAASNLAYVMYTSGSTGKPKGTAIEHQSIIRLVKQTNYAEFSRDEVFLQFAPISFDASTFELWGSLLNGARLVIFPAGVPTVKELGRFIHDQGITTLWLTAALFHKMVEEQPKSLQHVKQLLAGGEALSVPHVKKMLKLLGNRSRLINGYGPTENTTFTACHVMTAQSRIDRSVSIGKPISNTQVYILDRQLRPVPVGVYGELYIGGDGLARGYLNQPELTMERFMPNPFSKEPGARIYKTGDRVRYLEDGTIEFQGRLDQQVKLRGFRIEPAEIETVLAEHSAIREAVVLCREDDPGDKRLVAYIVPASENLPESAEMRRFVQQVLPAYMVPSVFVALDTLPLTPNGKVERDLLPRPEFSMSEAAARRIPPRTETEKCIAEIWKEVLQLDDVWVYDDFFEVGGHSLLAAQIINRLRDSFQLEIPLSRLFEYPTVDDFAGYIDAAMWSTSGTASAGHSDIPETEEGEI